MGICGSKPTLYHVICTRVCLPMARPSRAPVRGTGSTMKIAWKDSGGGGGVGKKRSRPTPTALNPNLPFEREVANATATAGGEAERNDGHETPNGDHHIKGLVDSFRTQGNQLAEDGKYHEALGKWETALNLEPKNAVLHEQKAQILLEIGDSWNALKAATQATELEPSWCEAWVTLGRAQLNFGEPDSAIESFDRALEIQPNHQEAQGDRDTALRLVKKRKQLKASGSKFADTRYEVRDKAQT